MRGARWRRATPVETRNGKRSDMTTAPPPVLQVENLQTHFFTRDGQTRAVDGVSFQVKAGETPSRSSRLSERSLWS